MLITNLLIQGSIDCIVVVLAGIGSISMRNFCPIRCFQKFWWTIQRFLIMIVHYDNELFLWKRKYTFFIHCWIYRLHDISSCYWRKRAPLNMEHCLSQIYLSIWQLATYVILYHFNFFFLSSSLSYQIFCGVNLGVIEVLNKEYIR